MMDSETMARMYAQVVNGQAKEDSRFVTDDESGDSWDKMAAEVAAIRKANPKAQFAIPNEVPLSDPDAGDDDPVTGPQPDDAPDPGAAPDDDPEPTEGSGKDAPAPADVDTTQEE